MWDGRSSNLVKLWAAAKGRRDSLSRYWDEFSVLGPVKILKLQLANDSMLSCVSISMYLFVTMGCGCEGVYVLWGHSMILKCVNNEISECSLSTAYKLSNWPQKNHLT